jgi:hypothetical protein
MQRRRGREREGKINSQCAEALCAKKKRLKTRAATFMLTGR